jgi:hypothetical protein
VIEMYVIFCTVECQQWRNKCGIGNSRWKA